MIDPAKGINLAFTEAEYGTTVCPVLVWQELLLLQY